MLKNIIDSLTPHSVQPDAHQNASGTSTFWKFFNETASPQLALREPSFRRMFEYLDTLPGPLTIVETGCVRNPGNWSGDGQSTVLFDRYINSRDADSTCHTVDINANAVEACRNLVSARVSVTQGDSVRFLHTLGTTLKPGRRISLLYLDSYDVEWVYWHPSAIHHLKELVAASRYIDASTLVVVDDCPQTSNLVVHDDERATLIGERMIGGKGRLIAEYANAIGATLMFSIYQAGWTGF